MGKGKGEGKPHLTEHVGLWFAVAEKKIREGGERGRRYDG